MKTLLTTILIFVSFYSTANNMIDSLKSQLAEKDTASVLIFIQENPEVLNTTDENGSSGFMIIAYSGLETVLNKAIALKRSFTFYEAIAAGKSDLVNEYLLSDDIVNKYSPDGFSPLALAAFFNHTEMAILLIENGGDPNLKATNPSKVNALHAAVAKENLALCEVLLNHGVDVNATQMQDVTPLHSAAHRGNLELVKMLVTNGADISLKMQNGDTAMSIAERDGHAEVLKYLKGVE
ncbi:ankyrin repeat domain-containing protein [Fulvivirga ligni]|uniref:ankyrin repeat domain-containing protein n=1 Tax=Fulvivirga ligni TaxID=2904246 RepID=UPI001F24DBFE|nr:ankyrin repeat domain-containing protein [Fulvivirga ligni]UII19093.1 ankyrin repeat domain-containing protein [Fulvivirga ligni]